MQLASPSIGTGVLVTIISRSCSQQTFNMTSYFPPEWHTIGREAELAVAQTGSGITALGRADHLHKGYYTQAFFGLSIGLERIAKLIIISDYAITNSGKFPSNDILRNVGHDIATLLSLLIASHFRPNIGQANGTPSGRPTKFIMNHRDNH